MKKESICFIIAIISATLITGSLLWERGMLVEAKAERAQEELAQEVLRFHVLANSDSNEDQKLKMKVKESLLSYMKEQLPADAELKQTREWIAGHLGEVEAVARETLQEASSEYPVQAKLETVMFPRKTYGDVTFPPGKYEALRVEIGAAEGQNWWCCLYPNLCFTSAVHAVVPEEEKEELQSVLSDDSYEMITTRTDYKIKWFFAFDGRNLFGGER